MADSQTPPRAELRVTLDVPSYFWIACCAALFAGSCGVYQLADAWAAYIARRPAPTAPALPPSGSPRP